MRDVAVVSFAQSRNLRRENRRNEVEMLIPVVQEAVEKSGIPKREIGFTCSGSSDYLAGQPFSFVTSLDAAGAWPPVCESHVEMDGAWALYEAWVKLQVGEQDAALVYCFGKSSMCNISEVLSLQLDPYYMGPLWPDAMSLAALQARLLLEKGKASERDLAEVVARSRRRQGQPQRPARRGLRGGRAAGGADGRLAAAQARLCAHLRRSGGRGAGRRRPGPQCV